jgi:hypothetical protein
MKLRTSNNIGTARVVVGDNLAGGPTLVDHRGVLWSLAAHRGRPVVLILHRHLA